MQTYVVVAFPITPLNTGFQLKNYMFICKLLKIGVPILMQTRIKKSIKVVTQAHRGSVKIQ